MVAGCEVADIAEDLQFLPIKRRDKSWQNIKNYPTP